MRSTSNRRGERGSITIFAIGGLLALLAFAALAIDSGQIYTARTQLAAAADAGALAAMQVLREGGSMSDALIESKRTAELNKVLSGGVQLSASDIVMGDYDYDARVFTPGGSLLAPAVKVTARRTSGSPSGRLPLALASVIGSPAADVQASAVASIGCREIVLVQDVTKSFAEEIGDAREALRLFVETFSENVLPGDQLGLVIFAADGRTLVPLSPMPQARFELETAIDQNVIDCWTNPVGDVFPDMNTESCNGTDQAYGINEARAIFDASNSTCAAERFMVIISDGVPCRTFQGGTEAGVMAAADLAEDDGLSIVPIMLWDPSASASQCALPGMGALEFNNSMARGWGRPMDTPDADHLDELLRSVLGQVPVRLVR